MHRPVAHALMRRTHAYPGALRTSIARCRALYQSLHCSRSGVVSAVPSLPVVISLAVSRCISSSIACSQSSYLSFHRLQFVVASVVPSLRLAALYQLFHPNRISRSIARGQLLYHWFHSSQSIVGSVCFIARGQSLYQSFHRVRIESVVLKLTVSLRIS